MFPVLLIVSAQRAKWQLFIFHFAASTKRAVEVGKQDPESDLFDPNFLTMYCRLYQREKISLTPSHKEETLLHIKPQIGFLSFELMFNKPVEYSTD